MSDIVMSVDGAATPPSAVADASAIDKGSKTPWTAAEDRTIEEEVRTNGYKWSMIAALLGGDRTDDAVRHRWRRLKRINTRRRNQDQAYTPANVAHGDGRGKYGDYWTEEEDDIIDKGVRVQGLTWSAIAALLPGRTESGCRQRWGRNEGKRLRAEGGVSKGGASSRLPKAGTSAAALAKTPCTAAGSRGYVGLGSPSVDGAAALQLLSDIATHHETPKPPAAELSDRSFESCSTIDVLAASAAEASPWPEADGEGAEAAAAPAPMHIA